MITHQELEEILEFSSAVYINMYLANIYCLINISEIDFLLSFFMLYFQVCFVLTLADNVQVEDTSRNISKFLKSLNLKAECLLALNVNYSVSIIAQNKKQKTNVCFLIMMCFQIIFVFMLVRQQSWKHMNGTHRLFFKKGACNNSQNI